MPIEWYRLRRDDKVKRYFCWCNNRCLSLYNCSAQSGLIRVKLEKEENRADVSLFCRAGPVPRKLPETDARTCDEEESPHRSCVTLIQGSRWRVLVGGCQGAMTCGATRGDRTPLRLWTRDQDGRTFASKSRLPDHREHEQIMHG